MRKVWSPNIKSLQCPKGYVSRLFVLRFIGLMFFGIMRLTLAVCYATSLGGLVMGAPQAGKGKGHNYWEKTDFL